MKNTLLSLCLPAFLLLAGCASTPTAPAASATPAVPPASPTAQVQPAASASATPAEEAAAGGYGLAWSPDGTRLALTGTDGQVYVFNMPSGATRQTLQHSADVFSVAFSPDGTRLAVGGSEMLVVWDLAAEQQVLTLPAAGLVFSLAFSPDGALLVSAGGGGGALLVWDAHSGELLLTLDDALSGVGSLAFSPDGDRLVSADSSQLVIWNSADWQRNYVRPGQGQLGYGLAFTPDGTVLASGHFSAVSSGEPGQVYIWDPISGEDLGYLEGCGGNNIAFSPDGALLASGCLDGSVTVWDFSTVASLGTMVSDAGLAVHSLGFSPDGLLLAVGLENGSLELWTVSDFAK